MNVPHRETLAPERSPSKPRSRAKTSRPPVSEWMPDFAALQSQQVVTGIADQIEAAIATGALKPGEQLATMRQMSKRLGFHLNTINAAFKVAASRGLIASKSRAGSIVLPVARARALH
ncbi:GntR family transcriptional regulator [Paraburkholderia sp. GAS32]|uniref:GntR family transcriptional regulator n=1 Tax=Paraburkholderia sp. GAS32 TaxID=3035129 RepID=UPI003D1F0216